MSSPLLSRPRVVVNSRVVIVGAGHTALAAVERLLFDKEVHLSHIAVIARYHPHLHTAPSLPLPRVSASTSTTATTEADEGGLDSSTADHRLIDGFLPSDFAFDRLRLQRLCLDARVSFIEGEVRLIDGEKRTVQFQPTAVPTHTTPSPHHVLPYDELLLATGLQPSTRQLSVVRARRTRLGGGVGEGGERVEGDGEEGEGEGRGIFSDGGVHEVGGTASAMSSTPPLPSIDLSISGGAASPTSASFAAAAVFPLHRQRTGTEQSPLQMQSRSASSSSAVTPKSSSSASSSRPLTAAASKSSRAAPAATAPLTAGDVSGVVCVSNEESTVQLLSQLKKRLVPSSQTFPPSLRVVVSGSSLLALSVLSGLVQLGISGESLVWVHPACHVVAEGGSEAKEASVSGSTAGSSSQLHRPLSLSQAVFEEEQSPALAMSLQAIANERIRIVQQSRISSLTVDATSTLHSISCSGGEALPCDLLLLCDDVQVDDWVYGCITQLGAVFDGRVVVDEWCRTRCPHVRAAGPMAKFQRRLLTEAKEVSPTQLRLQEYSSDSVGRLAASTLLDALTLPLHPSPLLTPHTTQTVDSVLSSLRETSLAVYTRLPGHLCFFHCWTPLSSSSRSPTAAGELSLSQSFPSYAFTLSYSPTTLCVVRVLYWGEWDVPCENLRRLVGVPLTHCNRLLHRWGNGQIRSLLLFLQQDWTALLYSNPFNRTRQRLVQQLTRSHAQHMRPLLHKLTQWQTAHAQTTGKPSSGAGGNSGGVGRLESARESIGGGGSRSAEEGAVDSSTSSLLSMSSFLPLHFKDSAHRALLTFIQQLHPLLPPSLHQPAPLPDVPNTNALTALNAPGVSSY